MGGFVAAQLAAVQVARAQNDMGVVTLMSGSPRMVGESIRPLQAVLSGQLLETGDTDAAGLLVEDVVIHVGASSAVTLIDEPGVTRVVIERGFVVFYTDPTTQVEIVAETPLGLLTAMPATAQTGGSGWYSVRHDPEQPGISPETSTFASMEGLASVEGTNPVAGPHDLAAGQRWQIIAGQAPGPVEEGDERQAANELRQLLHRQSIESLRPQTDPGRLSSIVPVTSFEDGPADVIFPDDQLIIDPNSANENRVVPPIPGQIDVFIEPAQLDFGPPAVIAAGAPVTANGQFVPYGGAPIDTNFNAFLASVDGLPAAQPRYLTDIANGGFSYLQIAGPGAAVVSRGGDTFLFEDAQAASGWALFTPLRALRDAGFAADSPAAGVVTEGFRAIAFGAHLGAGDGTIGGNGDPSVAFGVVQNGAVQLNPNPPAGYPLLDRANQTGGLEINGVAPGDQVAALSAGRNPQNLSQEAERLVFISDGNTDSLGNAFNFDGDPIAPTNLDLPADRGTQVAAVSQTSQTIPLAGDPANTVGIQFAGAGDTIAIIHHAGAGDPAGGAAGTSEHFEIVRGATFSIVQWRAGARINGNDGQPVEFEDLNGDPQVRNELFGLICGEVNALAPPDRHTVCGPGVTGPNAGNAPKLRRVPGSLTRTAKTLSRRADSLRYRLPVGSRLTKPRANLKPAGGRLIQTNAVPLGRRHIGRISPDR
jgi:hypothetical protein